MLSESLGITSAQVISLVGGGGKTTTMFKLARELANLDIVKIITTTTTRILRPAPEESQRLIIEDDFDDLMAKLHLMEEGIVTVAGGVQGPDKLLGIDTQWVDRLSKEFNSQQLKVIVEADGAAAKDFKFPRAGEPVVPESTDLLLPIVGARIAEKSLTGEFLHRANLLLQNSEFTRGQPISPEVVVHILLSKSGYDLLAQQEQRRVIPILNQVDITSKRDWARKVAHRLVKAGIERVLLTAMQSKNPLKEVIKA